MIPKYRKHNLLVIYVVESGSKVWLAGYLLLIAFLLGMFELNPVFAYMLVYIGVFSSCAEVSHYLCHTSTSAKAGFLASFGLLLSKRHHARHHLQDNCCYAFLNGVSDPLLNLIAAACCKGYKHNTDLHYEGYLGPETDNR
jgi:sterol desaturase/sphingolipid hydroxylase (fatty acid hydroxylase superfamily)